MGLIERIKGLDQFTLGIVIAIFVDDSEEKDNLLEDLPLEAKELYNELSQLPSSSFYKLFPILVGEFLLRKVTPKDINPSWIEELLETELSSGLYLNIASKISNNLIELGDGKEKFKLSEEVEQFLYHIYFPYPLTPLSADKEFVSFFYRRDFEDLCIKIGNKIIGLLWSNDERLVNLFRKITKIVENYFRDKRLTPYTVSLILLGIGMRRDEILKVVYLLPKEQAKFIYNCNKIRGTYFSDSEVELIRGELKAILESI